MNYNPNQNTNPGYNQSSYRSFNNPGDSLTPGNQAFPGMNDSFMPPPPSSSNLPVAYTPEVLPPKKGLANLINLEQIKGFVDRMGGIDGILNTVTKMQSVINSIAQIAPMVKVLLGAGKKGNKSASHRTQGSYSKSRKRRKKTTRKNYKRKGRSRR